MNLTNSGLTKAKIICFLITWEVYVANCLLSDMNSEFLAKITPTDSLVFIGESLQVQCELKDTVTDVDPNDMYFEITSHEKNLTWVVNRTLENCANTSVTNNRTLCATIEVTEKFSKKTTVSCSVERGERPTLRTTFIYAERPLQNVTNFSVVYNYNSETELSWSFGQTYLDPLYIEAEVDWNPNAPPNEKGNICKNETPQPHTWCIIPVLSGQDIIYARVNVTLKNNRKNKRPKAPYLTALFPTLATSVHKIVVNDCRKTLPPLNMRIVDVAMTCVTLTWDLSLYFNSSKRPVIYQLTVTIKSTMSVTNVHNGVKPYLQPNVTFCSLKPFTTYGLTMMVKGDEVNPWSDPAFIEVTTREDRPLTGPPVTDTSYYAGDCVSQERQVIVYWNDPLLYSLQGHLTHFEISVGLKNTSVRKGSNFFKANLDCDSNHTVLIYSATKMGTSMSPSKIVVPNMHDELPLLNDVTVRINGINETSMAEKSENVTVTWSPGQHGQNATLSFYMCQETNLPLTCFNDYTTKELSVQESEMVLTDIPSTTSLFGYALSDGSGRKRGIQWISCIYYAELRPKKLTSLNVVGLEESLLISWVSTKCDKETKIFILCYYLLLCTEEINYLSPLSDKCLKMTVSSTESTFTARDLKGGRPYYVYIEAESPAGLGPRSDPVTGTPQVSDLGREPIVGIVMGILAGLIGISIVVICFVRVCKNSKKKVESFAGTKCINWNEDTQSQTSKESGIGTDSSCTFSTKEETVQQPSIASGIKQHLIIPETASNTGEAIDTEMSNVTMKTLMVEVPLNSTLETTEENKSHKAVISESQTPSSPNIMNAGPSSDNANLYVKITNTNFASASDPSHHVTVDEGYNSPGMEVDSSTFVNTLHQTPDVFKQTNLSPISPKSLNMLQETGLPTSLSTDPPIEVYNVGRSLGKIFLDASASGPQSKDTFSKYNPQCDSEENQLKTQTFRSEKETFEESSSSSKDSNWLSKNLEAQSGEGHVQELHVACTIGGEMSFRTEEIMQKSYFVNDPSCFKVDIQPSSDALSLMLQQMADQNNVQGSDGNYKSVEFMEDGISFDSHGQSGTSEDRINCCDDGMVKNRIGHLVPRVGDYLRQTPLTAAPKNDDYLKQTALIAAPENKDYLRQATSNVDSAAIKNDDYLKQTTLLSDNVIPRNNDYVSQAALNDTKINGDYLSQTTLNDTKINCDYLSQATLKDTKINGDYLSQATLKDAPINGDYLSQATLKDAPVNVDYLSQATLNDTKIDGDYLSHAKLNDTKINSDYFSQATLNDTKINTDYLSQATLNGNVVARNDGYVTHPTLNGDDVVPKNNDYVFNTYL